MLKLRKFYLKNEKKVKWQYLQKIGYCDELTEIVLKIEIMRLKSKTTETKNSLKVTSRKFVMIENQWIWRHMNGIHMPEEQRKNKMNENESFRNLRDNIKYHMQWKS
jgi:hypothetical protein